MPDRQAAGVEPEAFYGLGGAFQDIIVQGVASA